ncbi:MAG TPA: hypothetical protein PLE30_03760 [Candidatus Kapabacteria bacterium]|nr:hypothetical protein [Candidatus Kapabacteria bacterium]
MKVVKYILIFATSILAIIILISLFLPSKYKIEREIIIDSNFATIEDYIIDLRKWEDWSYMSTKKDTSMTISYQQNNLGPYSSAKWKSKFMGAGVLRIFNYKPNKSIDYEIIINDDEHRINGTFFLDSLNNGIRVKWVDYGELGFNPAARVFGMLMEKYMGRDQESSLLDLKLAIEK